MSQSGLPHTGIIILAAGASSRMGKPKQLLHVNGESLLQRVVGIALSTTFEPVVVVLGANRTLIEPTLQDLEVLHVQNPDWESGMGSSIATGLSYMLQQAPSIKQVLVLVGDQPLLNRDHLLALADNYSSSNYPMVVSHYANTYGVPALFGQSLFPELLTLHGVQGAKALIQKHLHQSAVVDFAEGALDIDTPEEWAAFLDQMHAEAKKTDN